MTLIERFWSHVDKGPHAGGCWLWTTGLTAGGYGRLWVAGASVYAHRFAYELLVGPIPEGFTIDHVRARGCVHRHCVNPAHLEPVTQGENVRRGNGLSAQRAQQTHCKRGHELAGSNLYVNPRKGTSGFRTCLTCKRARR